VLDVGNGNSGFSKAIGDRMRRKACPVLDAAKSLLLGRSYQLAVAQQAGGRIGMEGIYPEDKIAHQLAGNKTTLSVRGLLNRGDLLVVAKDEAFGDPK
jgi:hypothetical protein